MTTLPASMPQRDGFDLLTPAEAAAMLHISERTLRKLRDAGLIRYEAISPRTIRYRPDDLADYLESCCTRKAPTPKAAPPCQNPSPKKGRHTGIMTSSSKVIAFTARPG